jgi:two-component system phosphate regulon sensor histidine kinase PhoR
MRPRGSIIGQLLIAFCVVAVLIGAAAVAGYATVTGQDAATQQLSGQDAALQQANSALEYDFGTAEFAFLYYRVTGQRVYMFDYSPAQGDFGRQIAVLRSHATPSIRRLVDQEASDGARWFTLVPRLIVVKPGSPADEALLAKSLHYSDAFGSATAAIQDDLYSHAGDLAASSKRALRAGLTWGGAALAIALLLVLVASLSTMYSVTRPLQRITATVRKLTAGSHAARAPVAGSAEVREVARSINVQADESDRLRAGERESNRLRAMAREAGLRIREHLVAADVLRAGQLAIEHLLETDAVYLRLIEGEQLSTVIGKSPAWLLSKDVIREQVGVAAVQGLRDMFRAQTSQVVQEVAGPDGAVIPAHIRHTLRQAGVVSQLLTPFGVGNELLGFVIAQRTRAGMRWTPAEVDAVESVAADLGRGLSHARLYETENRLVEELKSLDRAKSGFFATVSHELRAPLTTIEGYVEMFGDGEGGAVTAQQRQMLETIDRSTVRLRNLVEDVFMLAKLESGAFSTVMRPVKLAEIIAGAAEAVRPSVLAGDLTLTLSGPAKELTVEGDAGQLDRVLINLLSNAVKFTPRGGRIDVASYAEERAAFVCVTDTGIGVPAGDQKELFTRFFRASNATGRSIPGTGLGLAIVRMIVDNHGGHIGLRSREGAGTTVTVRLPLLLAPEALTSPDGLNGAQAFPGTR